MSNFLGLFAYVLIFFQFVDFPINGNGGFSINFDIMNGAPLIGLLFGLLVGVSTAMRFGGFAIIQHYCLRFILTRNDYLPWDIEKFLDSTVNFALMRKAGGGYMFIHPLFQEHFTNINITRFEL